MAAFVQNRKARFNYEIVETFEAGIELHGFEVKAIKNGQGSLDAAYVIVRGGEAYVIGAHIPPYQPGNTAETYDPDRNRRLLLTKHEIRELAEKEAVKGLAIIPLSLYGKGRRIKAEIAVGRGKKLFDKRESIKQRETNREMRRTLKGE
jgi:SsrA-binding protein